MQPNSITYNFCVLSLIFLALWQNGSCRSGKIGIMSQKQDRVANGNWGGPNAFIEVTEGGAQIRFTCAHGQIEGPLTLDAEGRFTAKGTFVAEAMGPTYDDGRPRSRPAVYSGVVRDDEMTLTVTVTGEKEETGNYNLTHGKTGSVRRCH
jgi:hypothetical protein